jgi:hypothetical protein
MVTTNENGQFRFGMEERFSMEMIEELIPH